jgi:predicted ATPase/DNA-binding CsgD family transcriptional regulator
MRPRTAPSLFPPKVPHQLTSFIGREIEMTELKRLLQERRLVTLTGAGGSGKTRLALEATTQLSQDFTGGIFLVELAPISRPELITEALIHVLGLEAAPDRPPLDALIDFLGSHTALLVLDNCEHLLDECARLAAGLLASCRDLSVLATSREPLGVSGECIFRVPLLSLPDSEEPSDPIKLAHFEAVQLFMDRARLANQNFLLTEKTAEDVAQVCIRLDGIPLALELAAASLRVLSISQLASHLDQRFRLLTSGNRTALPRHQTLQALLDWSYDLLDARQQIVFRHLAIFPADWTLDAAEAVCRHSSPGGGDSQAAEGVQSILFQLVDKSLVQLEHATGRYGMLETIRLYAFEKLEAEDEQQSTAHRHFAWYLNYTEQGSVQFGGPEQAQWFQQLEREQANVRTALSWAIQHGRAEEAVRLALALSSFWQAHAYQREARRWLEQVLELQLRSPLSLSLRARVLNALGSLAQTMNDFEQASLYYNQALSIWRDQGESAGIAEALLGLGWRHFQATELDVARRYAQESLLLARRANERAIVAAALTLYAQASVELGQLDGLVSALEESLSIWRDLGVLPEVALALITLARVEQRLGNRDRARPLILEALRLQIDLGNYAGLIGCLVVMAYFALDSGSSGQAPASGHEMPKLQQFDYLYGGKLPHGPAKAAQVLGVMSAWEEKVIGKHSIYWDAIVIPVCEKLSAEMGKAIFEQEFLTGEGMDAEGIIDLAEEVTRYTEASTNSEPLAKGHRHSPESLYPLGLTTREVEVLGLVASGLTNAQVADRLGVTPRTINAHLTSIYGKIGVTSRSGAVRFAVDHDLT